MGTFEENEMKSGTYIRADEKLFCEGATFLDGELTGTPKSLKWSSGEVECTFKGSFTESKPNGKGTLTYSDKTLSGTW